MRSSVKRALAAFAAVVIAIIWAFPVYWMINSSFLTPLTISGLEPTFLPFGGTLKNYQEVTTETPFFVNEDGTVTMFPASQIDMLEQARHQDERA